MTGRQKPPYRKSPLAAPTARGRCGLPAAKRLPGRCHRSDTSRTARYSPAASATCPRAAPDLPERLRACARS